LFIDEDAEEGASPQPYAIFGGTILRYEQRVNAATDLSFHHFEVETLGGVFDVVVEDEIVAQATKAPQQGGLLKGTFWMSGRVLSF
jgi:hypothetical protein